MNTSSQRGDLNWVDFGTPIQDLNPTSRKLEGRLGDIHPGVIIYSNKFIFEKFDSRKIVIPRTSRGFLPHGVFSPEGEGNCDKNGFFVCWQPFTLPESHFTKKHPFNNNFPSLTLIEFERMNLIIDKLFEYLQIEKHPSNNINTVKSRYPLKYPKQGALVRIRAHGDISGLALILSNEYQLRQRAIPLAVGVAVIESDSMIDSDNEHQIRIRKGNSDVNLIIKCDTLYTLFVGYSRKYISDEIGVLPSSELEKIIIKIKEVITEVK